MTLHSRSYDENAFCSRLYRTETRRSYQASAAHVRSERAPPQASSAPSPRPLRRQRELQPAFLQHHARPLRIAHQVLKQRGVVPSRRVRRQANEGRLGVPTRSAGAGDVLRVSALAPSLASRQDLNDGHARDLARRAGDGGQRRGRRTGFMFTSKRTHSPVPPSSSAPVLPCSAVAGSRLFSLAEPRRRQSIRITPTVWQYFATASHALRRSGKRQSAGSELVDRPVSFAAPEPEPEPDPEARESSGKAAELTVTGTEPEYGAMPSWWLKRETGLSARW